MVDKLVKETLPAKFATLAELMQLGDGRPFIMGAKPTWPDFVVSATMDFLDAGLIVGKVGEVNSALKEHQLRVEALPGVKEWIAKRPVTNF